MNGTEQSVDVHVWAHASVSVGHILGLRMIGSCSAIGDKTELTK